MQYIYQINIFFNNITSSKTCNAIGISSYNIYYGVKMLKNNLKIFCIFIFKYVENKLHSLLKTF